MSSHSPFILYVITDLEIGGVPLHLSRLAPAMRARGFRVAVVSLAPIGPVGAILRQQGVDVHTCAGCCGLDFRVIPRLGQLLDELHPALIHSFLFHANQAVRLAAMLGGFPSERLIAEIQTVEVERRWHLRVDRWMHRCSRLTITNSLSVMDHLHRHARIPRDRLRLVRGGIDVERITNAPAMDRPSLGLTHDDRLILWVGRLDPVKGLDHLLRAIHQLDSTHRARLFLVGDGPERDGLERLAGQLKIQDRIRFLGLRSDVPSLLKAAELFVFPSKTEGLPNALLEAMAAGLPIVTTDVAGCRDLVEHHRTGWLVPFGNPAALVGAMAELLRNREFARQLGLAAQHEVRTKWNLVATWKDYEAIYRDILGT